MKKDKQALTLDRPTIYQIKVPGHLDKGWIEWDGRMRIRIEIDDDGMPITTLTSTLTRLLCRACCVEFTLWVYR